LREARAPREPGSACGARRAHAREVEAEIARLYYAEHWKVGTIAAQLHVHEDVVRRVVGRLPKKAHTKTAAAAMVPYVDFVRETSIATRGSARRGSGTCSGSGGLVEVRAPCAAT
jgi:hypothetical protein